MIPKILTLAVIASAQSWSFSDLLSSVSEFFSAEGDGGQFLENVGVNAPDSTTFIQDSIDVSKDRIDEFVLTPARDKLEDFFNPEIVDSILPSFPTFLPDLGPPMYDDSYLFQNNGANGGFYESNDGGYIVDLLNESPISANLVLELLRDPTVVNPHLLSQNYNELLSFLEASKIDTKNIEDLVGIDRLKETLGEGIMSTIQDNIQSASVYLKETESLLFEHAINNMISPIFEFSDLSLLDPFAGDLSGDSIWNLILTGSIDETIEVDKSLLEPLIALYPESKASISDFVLRYAVQLREELLLKYPPVKTEESSIFSDIFTNLSNVDLDVGVFQLVDIIEREMETLTQETKQRLVDLIDAIPDDSLPFVSELKEAAHSLLHDGDNKESKDGDNDSTAAPNTESSVDLENEISDMMEDLDGQILSGQGILGFKPPMPPLPQDTQGFGSLRHRINKSMMMNKGISLINTSPSPVSLRPEAFKVTGEDDKIIGLVQVFDTPYYPGDALPSLSYLDINNIGNPFLLSTAGIPQVDDLKSFLDTFVTKTTTTTSTSMSVSVPSASTVSPNKLDAQGMPMGFDIEGAIAKGNSYVKDVFNFRRGNMSTLEMPDSMFQILGNKQQVAGILQLYNMPLVAMANN